MDSEVRERRIRSSRAAYPYVVLRYARLMEWSSAHEPKEVTSASMPIRVASYRIASATSLCAFSASMSRLPRDDLLDVQSDVQYYIIRELLSILCCARYAVPLLFRPVSRCPFRETLLLLFSSSRLVSSRLRFYRKWRYVISFRMYCTLD